LEKEQKHMKGYACIQTHEQMDRNPPKVVCVGKDIKALIPRIKDHVANILDSIGAEVSLRAETVVITEAKCFSGEDFEPCTIRGIAQKATIPVVVQFAPNRLYLSIDKGCYIALSIQETEII